MKTFIRGMEVWLPQPDATLVLSSAFYGNSLHQSALTEAKKTLAYDQGLAGKVWASGRPEIRSRVDTSVKSAELNEVTCSCAGIPIFAGDVLTSVIVIYCSNSSASMGAVEVWANLTEGTNELKLAEGFYNRTEGFEFISKRLTLMKGLGLPGMAWSTLAPFIMKNLPETAGFLRASEAREAGLRYGISIPLPSLFSGYQMLTLLSSPASPLAQQIEVWSVSEDWRYLNFTGGMSEFTASIDKIYQDVKIRRGDTSPFSRVWRTGQALATDEVALFRDYFGCVSADTFAVKTAFLLPQLCDGRLRSISVFYF